MLNGCQRLERKEFILWWLVEEIGVFLDRGHGVDDFNVGKKYDLPITCVVDEKGNLNESSGQFQGSNVLKDANDLIIEYLKGNNLLLLQENYKHRYPYDWRTKKPTIFRATEQWFASVMALDHLH